MSELLLAQQHDVPANGEVIVATFAGRKRLAADVASKCGPDMLRRLDQENRHFSDPYLPAREVKMRATSSITALGARSRIVPRAMYN